MAYPPPQPPQQPPVMHGYSQIPPNNDWAPPPVKRRGPLPWLIGALVLAVLVVGGLIAALLSRGDEGHGRQAAPVATTATIADADPTTEPPTEPAAASYTPKPSEFKLTPKITRKACFGSAGCNVSFRIELSYSGPLLSTDQTWLIVYEINGIEDAPQVRNLEMTGENFTAYEEDVSTKSSRSKITLKVTNVEKS